LEFPVQSVSSKSEVIDDDFFQLNSYRQRNGSKFRIVGNICISFALNIQKFVHNKIAANNTDGNAASNGADFINAASRMPVDGNGNTQQSGLAYSPNPNPNNTTATTVTITIDESSFASDPRAG
jgi:hypothetical protein